MFIRSLVTAAMVSSESRIATLFGQLADPHSTVAVAHCVREYTVKEGDYCDKISAAEGVST